MGWREIICTKDPSPVAVIDIGSNSIRLVVYEDETRSPTPMLNEKLLCGLGRCQGADGRLNKQAVERALKTLRRFNKLCEQTCVRRVHAFATEAIRSATDGAEFIRRAEDYCNTTIRVLNGHEEAQMAAYGIISGFGEPDGFVGDLGGGSLELVDLKGQKIGAEVSLPLGSLNLMEFAGTDYAKAAGFIDKHLDQVDWLDQGRGRYFYIIGGTWRSVARLHMMETGYPLSVMHHYRMSPADIQKLAGKVLGAKSKSKYLGEISRDRREMLPYGLLLLKRLAERVGISEFLVSAFGIREGILYSNLPPAVQASDPLISACEDMAARRARSFDYCDELFQWTDGLFQGKELAETAEERRLRHAACLINDIGWRGHPDYRGEKALGLIAQSAFVGVDHPGRAYLALSVYYGHERNLLGTFSPALRKLAGSNLHQRAQILGTAARVAYKLSANMPGILNKTVIGYNGANLVLQLPGEIEALEGESLRRRLKTLAQLLNCKPDLQILPSTTGGGESPLRALVPRR